MDHLRPLPSTHPSLRARRSVTRRPGIRDETLRCRDVSRGTNRGRERRRPALVVAVTRQRRAGPRALRADVVMPRPRSDAGRWSRCWCAWRHRLGDGGAGRWCGHRHRPPLRPDESWGCGCRRRGGWRRCLVTAAQLQKKVRMFATGLRRMRRPRWAVAGVTSSVRAGAGGVSGCRGSLPSATARSGERGFGHHAGATASEQARCTRSCCRVVAVRVRDQRFTGQLSQTVDGVLPLPTASSHYRREDMSHLEHPGWHVTRDAARFGRGKVGGVT